MEYKCICYTIDTENYNKELIKTKKIKDDYIILNNDPSHVVSETDNSNIQLYRSIVVDPQTNDILCFSPPSSIEIDDFIKKYPDYGDFIYTNEIVEGTMINLFYDKRFEKWEIASKGSIGGNYWFYRNNYDIDNELADAQETTQKTFRQMFLDAIWGDYEKDLNGNAFISTLSKDYCYSFVLQHPENHIVQPTIESRLYLIAVYEIDGRKVGVIPPTMYENFSSLRTGMIEFPKRYLTKSYSDFIKINTGIRYNKFHMGIMITNLATNIRTSIPNEGYEELKKLRGNNPNLQYHYFSLSAEQRQHFLDAFPMYTHLFHQFNRQYQEFVTIVHQAYFSYYVKKEGIEIAKKFFIHASKIHHQYYLPSLQSGEKIIITRPVVKEYFDSMEPNEILYYLYYDKRQAALEKKRLATKSSETDVPVEAKTETEPIIPIPEEQSVQTPIEDPSYVMV